MTSRNTPFAFLLFVSLVSLILGCDYFYSEEELWQRTQDTNSLERYEYFISRYPDSEKLHKSEILLSSLVEKDLAQIFVDTKRDNLSETIASLKRLLIYDKYNPVILNNLACALILQSEKENDPKGLHEAHSYLENAALGAMGYSVAGKMGKIYAVQRTPARLDTIHLFKEYDKTNGNGVLM